MLKFIVGDEFVYYMRYASRGTHTHTHTHKTTSNKPTIGDNDVNVVITVASLSAVFVPVTLCMIERK